MKIINFIFFPLIAAINLLRFLTILPLPNVRYLPLRQTAFMIPLTGLLIGGFVAGIYHLFYLLNLSPFVCAFLAIGAQIILTGALHEDGLADSFDALGIRSGSAIEKMQKTRENFAIGTYGILALIFTTVGKIMLITALINPYWLWAILPIAHALSRSQWVALLYMLPLLKGSNLAREIYPIHKGQLIATLLISLGIIFAISYYSKLDIAFDILLLLWVGQIYALYLFLRKKFSGISGDLLGATQQITEILMILFATIIIFLPAGLIFK